MNLIIDIGNTSAKVALIHEGIIVDRFHPEELNPIWIEELLADFPEINQALLSNVSASLAETEHFLHSRVRLHVLSSLSKLPFTNGYATPSTLGTDRMANAAAAVALHPNQHCLSIDLGTCIKCDFVDSTGVYHGGSISPGISLRFKAMNDYTNRLPLLLGETFPEEIIGKDTSGSMQSGVFYGILGELNGFISAYREKYENLKVVITGGDSHYFVPALKNGIFASPDFTLIGLNKILELNV